MQTTCCLNCGVALQAHQKYCSNCGQNTSTKPRITVAHLAHQFSQAFAYADKGLLQLLKELVLNPGKVAADYVEGKRKRYFNPFAFLALCTGLSLFIFNLIKPYGDLPQATYGDLAEMPTEHLRELSRQATERATLIQNFYHKYMSLLAVLVAPYFAFILWLFFSHRKRNVPEITLAYILFAGFGNLIFAVLICPMMAFFKTALSYNLLIWFNIFLQTLYFAWGLKVFFNYKSTGGFIGVLSVLMLAGLIGFIIILIFLFFYIYNGSFDLLYYLSQPELNK